MLTDFWRLPRSQDGYLYANTQAMATSFKNEVLLGAHQFGAVTLVSRGSLTSPTKDSFKAALYLASASLGAATTAYSATGEVSGTGYTAGGIAVTNGTDPSTSGTTAFWTPSASLVYSTVTLTTSFDAVLIYNSTQSNRAVSVHTFGSQTVTAGTFTLTMPTNDATNALIRFA
jgi:hypothetical protein